MRSFGAQERFIVGEKGNSTQYLLIIIKMLTNIELCLNSSDLKVYKSNLNEEHTKRGRTVSVFTNNQTKEEHHG